MQRISPSALRARLARTFAVAATLVPVAVASGCTSATTPPPEEKLGVTSDLLTSTGTFQRGTQGTVADTFLSAADMKKNFGSKDKLRISAKNEALLRFDLASIPANAVVNSATLTVFVNGGDDEDDDDCADGDREGFPVVPIKIHRATAAWSESTATYASFGQSFDPTVSGIIAPTEERVFKSVGLKALVQQWVAGTQPNNGMLIRSTGKKHVIFVSSEGTKVSLRPSLTVSYTTPDNHCAPNPCQNGGTCANGASGYTCACAPGYTGTTCQTLVDNCASNPCQNGGTCTNGVNTYTCACPAGYSGANCQTNTNDCSPNPCQNGGVCTDGVNSHTCACAPGYTGANCETLINNCASDPCQNGGTCTNGVNTYTCSCPAGFSGANCQTNIDDCAPNPCQNGGTCSDGVASYTCSCAPGYAGSSCQTLIDNCAGGPCQNGGSCTNGVNSYTCSCAPGYSGARCEVDVNECATNPCQNGGLCVDGVNSYTCSCPAGYSGANCEINACAGVVCAASDACHAAGVCQPATATCTNPPLADGTACDDGSACTGADTCQAGACSGAPVCSNGATCSASAASYTCSCAPGYSGAHCQCLPPPTTGPTQIAGGFIGAINAIFDPAGNMYVSAFYGGYVSKVAPGASTGPQVFNGSNPDGLAMDSAGNVYIAWAHNSISRLDPVTGSTAVVVSGLCDALDMTSGPNGHLYVSGTACGLVYEVDPTTGAVVGSFSVPGNPGDTPRGLSFDAGGNLFIANGAAGNVYKRTPAGALGTFASGLSWPLAVRTDGTGNVYVSNYQSNRIVKLSPDGSACPSALVPDGFVFSLSYDGAHNLVATDVNNWGVFRLSP